MEQNPYERAKALFLLACDQPESVRRDFVDRRCGEDVELRAAVFALLDFDSGDDLAPPVADLAEPPVDGRRSFTAGDVFADRFRIVSSLGRGGMGEVYHAVDLTLDVSVALKFPRVVDAAHLAQLVDEVKLARSVTHPAVARIYDIGSQDDLSFVSMEFIRGDDLGALLRRVGRLSPERVVEIGVRVCQGLAAAHEAGVLHRDVKPSNVLIDEAGLPKLIDFGIATPMTSSTAPPAGTPSYMAPEQLRGDALSEQSDLWALGAVLYEMCTGTRLFDGNNLDSIQEAHRSPIAPPSALGIPVEASFEDALMSALAYEPARRPASASEFARSIGDAKRASPNASVVRPAASGEPERRRLTVLHCEICDSSNRLETLDPEDLEEIASVVREELARVATRYEAVIDGHEELGVTIQFGYPVAQEDAAIRAVLAAQDVSLRLGDRLRAFESSHEAQLNIQLGVQLGIHVGSAVVTTKSGSDGQPMLTGNVGRIARQLAGRSSPGEILVSLDTQRLLGRRFDTQRAFEVGNVLALRVLGESETRARTAIAPPPETPFIGRSEEVSLILERLRRAEAARGQLILVSGDGGVGKSRILQHVQQRPESEGFEKRWVQCSPYMRNTAFQPVIDLLRSELALDHTSEGVEAVTQLERMAEEGGLGDAALRRIAALVSIPLSGSSGELAASASAQRDQVLDALSAWLLRSASDRPVMIVFEDLHWADPSTIDLLEQLGERIAGEAAVVIATFRPEWSPHWPPRSHATTMNLSPLTDEQTAELLRAAGASGLERAAFERLVERSDGIPLFAEELARHASDETDSEIPETLRDTLLARLDRMGEAKPIAQSAAVLGRDFDLDALVAVCGRSREEVSDLLDALVRGDFLYRKRHGRDGPFAFRHALLRDAAYSSLIRARRVALHSRALDVLRENVAFVEHSPEILAFHAEVAGREPLILEFRQRAAERAADRLANREVVSHATRALEALEWQPRTPARDRQELRIQSLLAVSLLAIEGFGSEVTERAFDRARALCMGVEGETDLGPILYGVFAFHETRANAQSLVVADEITAHGVRSDDPVLENIGHANRGHFRLWNGEIESCRTILRGVSQSDDRALQRELAIRFGDDPIVCSPATLACAECALGETETGRRTLAAAVERAEELGHPMTLAAVLTFSSVAAQILDDVALCDKLVSRNETVCRDGRFPNWQTAAFAQRGWIEIRKGRPAEGIAKVESAISRCSAIGQRLYVLAMEVFVAEGELALGRAEAAVAAADRALRHARETHERLWLPEAYRIRAKSLLSVERESEAKQDLLTAVSTAREQGTLLFELRAAHDLYALSGRRGEVDRQGALLADVLSRVPDEASGAEIDRVRAALQFA